MKKITWKGILMHVATCNDIDTVFMFMHDMDELENFEEISVKTFGKEKGEKFIKLATVYSEMSTMYCENIITDDMFNNYTKGLDKIIKNYIEGAYIQAMRVCLVRHYAEGKD